MFSKKSCFFKAASELNLCDLFSGKDATRFYQDFGGISKVAILKLLSLGNLHSAEDVLLTCCFRHRFPCLRGRDRD